MPGWGVNRFASLTDVRSCSTNDESVGNTQSAPALSRKENSCESTSGSKFAEAMKNPNWRRRREMNISQASTDMELSYEDLKAEEIRKGPGPNTGAGGNANHGGATPLFAAHSGFRRPEKLPAPWDFITRYSDCGLDHKVNETDIGHSSNSRDARYEAQDVTPLPKDTGVYQLIRRVDLPGIQSQGKAVSIFELTPIECEEQGREGIAQWDLIQVQKFDKVIARTDGEGHFHKPPAIPRHGTAWLQNEDEAFHQVSRISTSVEKARKAVFEDPAVADVGLSHRVPDTNVQMGHERVLSTSKVCDKAKSKDSLSSYLREKNIAFNKMLQKLYKGSGQRLTSNEQTVERGQAFRPRTLTQKMPFRKPDSSDSGLGSMDASLDVHYKESSRDSALSADSPKPSTRLNPRAREFLCLGVSCNATTTEQAQQGSSPYDDRQAGQDQRLRSHDSLVGAKQPSGDALPPTDPLTVMNSGQLQQLGGTMQPGLIGPLGFMLPPGFAPFGLPSAPTLAPPPGLPPPGLGLVAVPFNAPSAATGTQLPPVMYRTPQMAAPLSSVGAQGMFAAPPPPVPKPRKPDPANQQAYEAYLEWRKANEPGYAMECRQRQQRRAQRQLTARSKVTHRAGPEIAAKS